MAGEDQLLERVVTPRPIVGQLAIDNSAVPESFIGLELAPEYEVDTYRFLYPVYGTELLQGAEDDKRGVRGEYKEIDIAQEMKEASLQEHGRKAKMDARERQEARAAERRGGVDPTLALEARLAAACRAQVVRHKEYEIAKAFNSTGNYSASHLDATIDPLADDADVILAKFDTLRQAIVDDTGFEPNVASFGRYARQALRRNPSFRDLMPADSTKVVTQQVLADLFEIPRVIWGSPVISMGKGKKPAPMWDDVIWLGYVDPNTNAKTPTFARTFWMPYEDGNKFFAGDIQMRPEPITWVWYAEMYETVILGKDLGALIHSLRP